MTGYKRKYKVYCSECRANRDTEADVEFIDIEEDIQGYDKMTFRCKSCGTEQSSNVRG